MKYNFIKGIGRLSGDTGYRIDFTTGLSFSAKYLKDAKEKTKLFSIISGFNQKKTLQELVSGFKAAIATNPSWIS